MQFAFLQILKKYDTSFFIIASAIFLIGILNLYSGTHMDSNMTLANLYKRQLILYLFAILVGLLISFIRPKALYRYSYAIYIFNIILLALVLWVGDKGMGAKRWLVMGPIRIQPSELMKISVILALARWYSGHGSGTPLNLKGLIIPFIMAAIPAIMIIIEPDLGTGLIILIAFAVISFYRNLKLKTMAILFILALVGGTTMYNFGLEEYQRKRIVSFLDPAADLKGSGYNAHQSKIAIGSGQLFGKGFKKSSQASLNYLPENHTDFVFSVFNEEHGFFGSLVLIILYIVLFFRFIWLSSAVVNLYESIIAIGIMSLFFSHTIINISMTIGLLPIVGLPLPLMSYGGSNLLTFGIGLGMATGISNSRILF
ncbi:MAG: rod shape-determining protein RodA [Bacteriovoracales bacterium]|nr:rod shape-determining protein RodA [Bacteriovoracales bacterium]